MYRLTAVTAIGNYVVEVEPEKEDYTNDDLMELFYRVSGDMKTGAFMEGWTPTDSLSGPPGVFALEGVDILAFHVSRVPEPIPVSQEDQEGRIMPLTIPFDYLGNTITAKCVQGTIGGRNIIFCYSLNGETPIDVLPESKVIPFLESYVEGILCYAPEDYILHIANDGKLYNFSKAVDTLKEVAENYAAAHGVKTGKAWMGWKGDGE